MLGLLSITTRGAMSELCLLGTQTFREVADEIEHFIDECIRSIKDGTEIDAETIIPQRDTGAGTVGYWKHSHTPVDVSTL